MRCEFSEMQFVFGIVNELVNKHWTREKAWISPRFPTSRKEKELGYDFSIKGPVRTIFMQFKVPEKFTRKSSKRWSRFKREYFRFKIWPDNLTHQHNNLIKLAKADPHNKVYYCSPGFIKCTEYDKYYKDEVIAIKSIYVPCKGLATIKGDDKHEICYRMDPDRMYKMYSEERNIVGFTLEQFWADVENAPSYESIDICIKTLAACLDVDTNAFENKSALLYELTRILAVNYNLSLVLLWNNN